MLCAFTDVTFSDLFKRVTLADNPHSSVFPPLPIRIGGFSIYKRMMLSPGNGSCYVTPTEKVVKHIIENMIAIKYDSIYFRATFRDDEAVLLSVEYNAIIGSRWLAVVTRGDVEAALKVV